MWCVWTLDTTGGGLGASLWERVSLCDQGTRGSGRGTLDSTAQVTIMCHGRKRAPLHGAIVGEQAQRARVGGDAFGQRALAAVAQRARAACRGLTGSQQE